MPSECKVQSSSGWQKRGEGEGGRGRMQRQYYRGGMQRPSHTPRGSGKFDKFLFQYHPEGKKSKIPDQAPSVVFQNDRQQPYFPINYESSSNIRQTEQQQLQQQQQPQQQQQQPQPQQQQPQQQQQQPQQQQQFQDIYTQNTSKTFIEDHDHAHQ